VIALTYTAFLGLLAGATLLGGIVGYGWARTRRPEPLATGGSYLVCAACNSFELDSINSDGWRCKRCGAVDDVREIREVVAS